jgi:PHD/YefM family antitoxin component YafN of YafNO toxin-antitoxin module
MRTRILISVTELRLNSARVLEQLRSSPEPLFITQYGYVTAVLLAPRQYEDLGAAARLNHRRRIMNLEHDLWDRETARLRDEGR